MKTQFNTHQGANKNITLLVLTNNETINDNYKSLNTNCIFCHIDIDGHNISKNEIYNEQNSLNVVHSLEQEITNIDNESKVIVIGANYNADIALDLVLKGSEFIEGAVLIKPVLNLGLSESVMNYDNKKVCIILGSDETESKQAAEEEVNDILEANGYDTSIIKIAEGGEFSESDVQASINWIKKNLL